LTIATIFRDLSYRYQCL